MQQSLRTNEFLLNYTLIEIEMLKSLHRNDWQTTNTRIVTIKSELCRNACYTFSPSRQCEASSE